MAIAVMNKLITSNFVNVSVNKKFNPYGKELSNSMQLVDL